MNNYQPLISIGLPVFNGENHLRQAIDSLLAQSYRHFELIICDNASTDRTEEICRSYCAKDSRLHYQRNAANLGILPNWRLALDSASGEYFMWAAHDDWWSREYIEALLATLVAHPNAVLAAGKTVFVGENGALRNDMEPDEAPHCSGVDPLQPAKQLLRQHATNWLHGLYPRKALLALPPTLFVENAWGSDVLFLLELSLGHEVVGSDSAILYKRVAQTQRGQPKTALEQTRWQAWFARALLRVVLRSPLSASQKMEMSRVYLYYLKSMYCRKGLAPWLMLWARSGCQLLRSCVPAKSLRGGMRS